MRPVLVQDAERSIFHNAFLREVFKHHITTTLCQAKKAAKDAMTPEQKKAEKAKKRAKMKATPQRQKVRTWIVQVA